MKKLWRSVGFFFLPILLTQTVSASIVTETPDAMYTMSESELFQMLQQQNMVLNGFNLDSVSIPLSVKSKVGDQKALEFVGQLLASDDARGPLALANYLRRYPNDLLALQLAASELVQQEKYPEAELTLQKILQAEPNFHSAVNLLGLIRVSQKQYDVAAQIFTRVLVRDNRPNPMAAKYLAWLSLRSGNVAQAETALLYTLRKDENGLKRASPLLLELAELYRRQSKHSQIVHLLKDLMVEDSPTEFTKEALSRRLEAASEMGETQLAQGYLDELLPFIPGDVLPVQLSRARIHAQNGEFEQALARINDTKTDSALLEAKRLIEKAKIQAVAQDSDGAAGSLKEYLELVGTDSFPGWQQYSDLMIKIGKGNVLLQELRKATQNSEVNDNMTMLLVDTLIEAGDLGAANRVLDEVLNKDDNFGPAHYRKGILLFDNGDNDAAAESFKAAVSADPQDIGSWLALFGALHDHRVHDHASGMAAADHADLMPLFDQAISANPESITLLYEKGLTAYSGSELSNAKVAFDQAVAKAPLHVPSVAMAAIVRADENSQPKEALSLARRGESLDPGNPAVIDAVGWALVRSGQLDEGIQYLDRALQLMPGDEAVLAHLAEAYIAKGNIQQGTSYTYDAMVGTLPDHTADSLRAHLIQHLPMTSLSLSVNSINAFGVGESVGTITITQQADGVLVKADVVDLPEGLNGMHFHEKPSCEAGLQNGERVTGLAAGGHYGHGDHMMMDMGDMDMSNMSHEEHMKHMQMMKPKGDLPPLPIGADGTATGTVIGADLTIDELRGRSLIIHQGPDVDGVSGPKIACAVIP